MLLSPDHGRWLTALGDVFDLVWATSWEQDADLLIAERVGLPRGLPFITFTEQSGWTSKLPDVSRFVGERATAWVDDQFDPEAHAWAQSRDAPTLLVETDHRVGLKQEHVVRLRDFAAAVSTVQAHYPASGSARLAGGNPALARGRPWASNRRLREKCTQ